MAESTEETEGKIAAWRMPDPAKLWDSLGGSIDGFVTVIDPECRVRAAPVMDGDRVVAAVLISHDQRALLAIDEARRLINGLRPPMLDELGVLAAVESLVMEGTLAGREIEYRRPATLPPIDTDLATAVFRIVQESLSNVRKHSRGTSATVTLATVGAEGRGLSVEVVDDGVGFDPAAVATGAFGLEGIRRRARHFGAEACIESAPGKGTRVAVVFPVGGVAG